MENYEARKHSELKFKIDIGQYRAQETQLCHSVNRLGY